MRSKSRRPFGLIAIVILQVVSLSVPLVDLLRVQAGQPSRFLPGVEDSNIVLIVNLGVVLVQLGIAFGLWWFKSWAWFLIMFQLGVGMTGDIWRYIEGSPPYFSMLLNVIMVFYLNQREIQQAFEHEPAL